MPRVPLASVPLFAALLALGSAAVGQDAPSPESLLASKDPVQRIAGLEALEKLGKDPAREKAAIRALADPDWGVAIRAARALATLGGKDAGDALARIAVLGEIAWLREAALASARAADRQGAASRLLHEAQAQQDPELKARAIEGAGALSGAEALKKLRPHAKDRDPRVASAAVRAVGALASDPAARDAVMEFLEAALGRRDDRKHFLAYAAAVEALAAAGTPGARDLLAAEVALQPDDDDWAPARAARALAAAGPEEAGRAVLAAWPRAKDPAALRRMARLAARTGAVSARDAVLALLAHRDDRVRAEAAKAVGRLGDAASIARLEPLLVDPSRFARLEAWAAVARLEAPSAFRRRALPARADPDEEVRVGFVAAIADAGDPEGIPVLEGFFQDRSWRVSSAAIATAGTLGVADDLPRLSPLLAHRAWQVRAAAYEATGRLRAAKAVPLLTEGLLDKDPVVRGVCHANLQILTQQKYSSDAKLWRRWWEKHGADLAIVKRSRRSPEEIAKEAGAKARYAHEEYARKRGVEILQKARILVVTGAWDHVERVLDHLRIPNTALRAQELKAAGLNPNQVVLVNCEGNLDSDSAERLKWFVNVGGYLMSTDWAVTKAVNLCFPGYLRQFAAASTGNDVVVVEEAWPGHPYTAGIFDGVPALQWWLEIQAFPLSIAWPERTDVLVDSREMRHRYGASPMAVSFRYGLGKVQHSVSHFFLQEEALAKATAPRERMVFAADHLGLSIEEIRDLAGRGQFEGQLNEEAMKEIAPGYSMFRLIVNFVREKSAWVEGL